MPLDRELTKELDLSRNAYERDLRQAQEQLELVRENISERSWISRLWHAAEDRALLQQVSNDLAFAKARNEVAHEIVDWLQPQIERGINKAIHDQLEIAQQRTRQPEREPQRGRQRKDIDLER